MATTPMVPPNPALAGNPNFDGAAPPAMAAPQPPGTDMTGICFRDQLWLNTYPLDRNLVFDYFALSPFYDYTCNNEQLRLRSIHPLDHSQLLKMTGIEYMLTEVTEPHLFVIRKQKRDSPEKVTPMLTYYVLDGSIYQAPQLCNVFAARVGRALYHISKAFTTAASKLEKIGFVDAENEKTVLESKATKDAIDIKELKRLDHILASLQRKLPAAPPPPPFPEGYAPPTAEGEKSSDNQQADTQPPVDPIIDQGPSKRRKF
ncbi:mediator of RNA polymerase II transcription subunit 6 [Olea europaea var. sylvestris]|uniref:Mediator of RNA polymerase II transcription subunit 6 n=1 Tax=Olea europaea subsp. europaea TaxID=158383 RepID=A0A8S0SU05_OLEEU|nr:mediator of RNA polymerase II transcription subunit 6 [Olea europaea var. sylvestris]CAA2995649.1 mediator of RNA polymerase II transcription subunit 6 [Olea europaea subsp. europaea]